MSNALSQGRQLVSLDDQSRFNQAIDKIGIVPVVAVGNEGEAINVAAALAEGGIPIIEIVFRTSAAAAAIAAVRDQVPDVLVGAGTVLTAGDVDRAVESGAQFGVAPGFSPGVCARASDLVFPFVPGVATPSEVALAIEAGFRVLKLFPAEVVGGLAMLRGLKGPFGHTGVRFIPTGGIDLGLASGYWTESIVAAVGGSWLVPNGALRDRDWQAITRLARDAVIARADCVRDD
jgi:2-dehydro-3-deoxyphosphogluconate aldolase/(4S)-4-hydroxy-2-oxoglutarate aldolase